MTPPHWRSLPRDLAIGLIFFTRLPLPYRGRIEAGDLARAVWATPLVGALVGGIGALAYWLATWLGLPPAVAAGLALAALLLATGCFHEDGLADVADGFGGGWTRERKLEIMRDSRLGTYGTATLVVVLLLRFGALASLGDPAAVALALVAAGAAARAPVGLFMRLLPAARTEGLSAYAGRPPGAAVAVGLALGLAALLLCLGLGGGLLAAGCLLLAALAVARLCLKQIGSRLRADAPEVGAEALRAQLRSNREGKRLRSVRHDGTQAHRCAMRLPHACVAHSPSANWCAAASY